MVVDLGQLFRCIAVAAETKAVERTEPGAGAHGKAGPDFKAKKVTVSETFFRGAIVRGPFSKDFEVIRADATKKFEAKKEAWKKNAEKQPLEYPALKEGKYVFQFSNDQNEVQEGSIAILDTIDGIAPFDVSGMESAFKDSRQPIYSLRYAQGEQQFVLMGEPDDLKYMLAQLKSGQQKDAPFVKYYGRVKTGQANLCFRGNPEAMNLEFVEVLDMFKLSLIAPPAKDIEKEGALCASLWADPTSLRVQLEAMGWIREDVSVAKGTFVIDFAKFQQDLLARKVNAIAAKGCIEDAKELEAGAAQTCGLWACCQYAPAGLATASEARDLLGKESVVCGQPLPNDCALPQCLNAAVGVSDKEKKCAFRKCCNYKDAAGNPAAVDELNAATNCNELPPEGCVL